MPASVASCARQAPWLQQCGNTGVAIKLEVHHSTFDHFEVLSGIVKMQADPVQEARRNTEVRVLLLYI
jgi:hypothetical protein